MKKIVLSLAIIAGFVSVSFAQTTFGVQAGIAAASMKMEEDGESLDLDSKIGFTLGVVANVGLSENFSFRPALNFVQKGGKEEGEIMGISYKQTMNLNYLELPLNFVYNTSAGSGQFFIGAGPSLSFGLSGKTTAEVDGEEESEDLNFGNGDDEVKPFEFGGNILAGYQLANGVSISVNYNMGFSNLSNVENSEAKNKYFGVRLGYNFGGNK